MDNVKTVYPPQIQFEGGITKWHVLPAKTQISLGIHAVWSESSLCVQQVVKGPMFLHADSEDSDRWVHMPFCWFCHAVAHLVKPHCIHFRIIKAIFSCVQFLFINFYVFYNTCSWKALASLVNPRSVKYSTTSSVLQLEALGYVDVSLICRGIADSDTLSW